MPPPDPLIPATLLDALRDAVIYTDLAGRIVYWNQAAERIFGYTAADMLGLTPAVLYPDASAERLTADLDEIAGGRDFTGPWMARRKDGSDVWIEVVTTLVRDASGQPVGYVGVSRDISQRLTSEAALRASEGQFRALAESASDGIVTIDLRSTILFANEGIGRIFGYPPDELIGTDLTRLMPEYLQHLHRTGMARYAETGVRHVHWASTELPGRHRDGHIVPLEISFGETRNDGRHVFTGIIRDITARKRIERRLTIEHTVAQVLSGARSESGVLAGILQALGQALGWQWGAIWARNDSAEFAMRCVETWSADPSRFAGFAQQSRELRFLPGEGLPGRVMVSGTPLWVNDIVDDPDFARATDAGLLGLRRAIAFPIRRLDETQAVIEFLAERVEEPDPELLGLMATVGAQVGQFLERRRAEAALAQSEERYRSLVEASSQLVWTADPEGNFADELPSWAAYTGQPFEAYRGVGWIEALHPDDRDGFVCAWRAAVDSRRPLREVEARIRRADGEYGTFTVRGVPIVGAGRELREWVGTCTDITARKRHEERLHQADRMESIGRLAGGVAHEANNQMSVVLGSATFLLRRPDLPEAARQDVEHIRQAAERTAAITAQLLAFGRRQVLQPKLLDLEQEVRGLETILRRTLGDGYTLVLHSGLLTGKVRADPGQLAQVLLNLTFNARDAMPDGGTLTIRTSIVELTTAHATAHPDEGVVPGRYVRLVVSDTGQGMDRGTLSRIFEPFFTTKPIGKGTGLGLSSVHGIVRQSGGHVWASSEPGIGTTFEIYLPAAREQGEEPAPSSPRSIAQGTGTVLVAENEALVRDMITRTLRESGYEVVEVADGEEAIAALRNRPRALDLVILDVIMPRMGGREFAAWLERERPGTRVLFISGFPDLEVVDRGLLDGGRPFLQKPFAPETLERIVKDLTVRRAEPNPPLA